MSHSSSYSYLNDFLQRCLGVKDVLLPESEALVDVYQQEETLDSVSFSLSWEPTREADVLELQTKKDRAILTPPSESQAYSVIFIRKPSPNKTGEFQKNGEALSLAQHPQALELFYKLRQAMGLNSFVAPYVELNEELQLGEESFIKTLAHLRLRAHKIIIMVDDCLQIGDQQNEWIIPDPIILECQPHLKRSTWELLKKWLALNGS